MESKSGMNLRRFTPLIFAIVPLGVFLWHVLISVYEQSVNQAAAPWVRSALDIFVFFCVIISAYSLKSHQKYKLPIIAIGFVSVCLSISWIVIESAGPSIGGGLLAFLGWLIYTAIGALLLIWGITETVEPAGPESAK